MTDLHQALRRVLGGSPASIEELPPMLAASVDRIVEASLLEPLLYDRAHRQGVEGRLSQRRRSAWQLSHACALARFGAQREALETLREEAHAVDATVEAMPATQMAFFVHPAGELRPVVAVEVHVRPDDLKAVHSGMRRRRFCPYDEQGGLITEGSPPSRESRLPRRWVTLEHDGVLLRFHGMSPTQELGFDLPTSPGPQSSVQGLRLLSKPLLEAAIEEEILKRRLVSVLPWLVDLQALLAAPPHDRRDVDQGRVGPSRVLRRLSRELLEPEASVGPVPGEWSSAERRLLRLARLAAPQRSGSARLAEGIGETLAELLQPRNVLEAARAGS